MPRLEPYGLQLPATTQHLWDLCPASPHGGLHRPQQISVRFVWLRRSCKLGQVLPDVPSQVHRTQRSRGRKPYALLPYSGNLDPGVGVREARTSTWASALLTADSPARTAQVRPDHPQPAPGRPPQTRGQPGPLAAGPPGPRGPTADSRSPPPPPIHFACLVQLSHNPIG